VSPDGRSVYVADTISGDVFQYDVAAGGALTAKSPASVPAGLAPFAVAVRPDGGSVYVVNSVGGTISQYDVGPGGLLTPKTPAEVPAGAAPVKVAVSPDGDSVYVTNAESGLAAGTVSQFDARADGTLTPKNPPEVATGLGPHHLAVSPDGRSLYVANSRSGNVWQYNAGADGALTPKSPPAVAAPGAVGVAVSDDATNVYVTTLGPTDVGTVSQYDVGAGGVLIPKDPPTVDAGFAPAALAVSPAVAQPVPTSIDQCKHGGWRRFGFKNQGQCVAFVVKARK
jgi:DNA-binding beta-propeller fold protein YncE